MFVHWNEDEAKDRARKIAAYGHKVTTLCSSDKEDILSVRNSPPELFVIDLNRLPSHGREIAGYFRRTKSTRQVPILFVDGDEAKKQRAQHLIPDAEFAKAENIERAIKKAIRKTPVNPGVPGAMAGYSGTPLPKKLGIREDSRVLLINAPERFERKLEPLPAGAGFTDEIDAADVAVLFAASQAELMRDFRPLTKTLPQKVAFWIAWPKKASGVKTDLNENVVREFGLGSRWVDYKVCAIDETWSGLCFARKK